MRTGTKILSLFLAVLMFMMVLPITAFAAKQETYIKEIRISTASTAEEAKQWLLDNDYIVVDADLNQKTGKDCVYIGYKTTTNPDEAITDLSLMQMDGGYSFAEYEALLENKTKEINNMLDSLEHALAEARANLAAGKKTAQGAREVLNFFKEDDSGMLLGDFLLGQETSREDLVKIFLQSSGDVATIIYSTLALACTDNGEDTNWLAKLKDVDIYGDYDPVLYSDATDALFDSFVNIHDMVVTYENEYKGIADQIANNSEYADYTDEEIEDLLPDSYAEYTLIYETLANYQYGGKPLLDFFMKDPDEIDADELYPVVSALSAGQREIIKFVGLMPLISFAQSDETTAAEFVEAIKGSRALFGSVQTVSVYYGVDRSLFEDGGVALTTASLRKSASTGDNSWFSGDNIDPVLSTSLHIVAGSCTAIGVGAAIGAKFAKKAATATYETVLKTQIAKFPQTLANLENLIQREAVSLATTISHSSKPVTAGEMYETALQQVIQKRSPIISKVTSGDYCEIVAKEASANLTRLGVAMNVVMGVALGISLIAEAPLRHSRALTTATSPSSLSSTACLTRFTRSAFTTAS